MVEFFLSFLLFSVGASVGSFLNVLIDRIPKGEKLFLSRSSCDNCHKLLFWFDLIPVFSWLILKGKCRYCKNKISARILFVEILAGLVFLFAYFYNNLMFLDFQSAFNFQFIHYLLFIIIFSCLLVIFFTDFEYGIIPDLMLIVFGLASLILKFIQEANLIKDFLTGVFSFLFFLFIFFVTRTKGMGFGDVKFSFLIGFFLGWPMNLISFYASFLTGAVASLILIMLGKKKFRKDSIAFGPFLIIGFVLAFFWGEGIWQWFMSLL